MAFASGESKTVDLVIGADGLHSGVRRLAFGDESAFVRHLGYYVAGWDLPNKLNVDGASRHFNVPGRMASVRVDGRDHGTATALFVFASPRLDYGWHDLGAQKKIVSDAFAGMGWHVPHLLASLRDVDDMYFDSISRVHVPRLSAGRVALVGDAGYGVTLGGMGVGTGLVAAYALAGELALARGDHAVAFPEYERRIHAYASRWQRGANPGAFLAPKSAAGLRLRNAMFKTKLVQRTLVAGTKSLATDTAFPDYPGDVGAAVEAAPTKGESGGPVG